jgi:hypothetical protein
VLYSKTSELNGSVLNKQKCFYVLGMAQRMLTEFEDLKDEDTEYEDTKDEPLACFALGLNSSVTVLTSKLSVYSNRTSVIISKDKTFIEFDEQIYAWFVDNIDKLRECISSRQNESKIHIGATTFVTVCTPDAILIAEYFEYEPDDIRQTKNYVMLNISEWEKLIEIVPEVNSFFYDLAPCYAWPSHCAQEGFFTCQYCFGFPSQRSDFWD